MGFMTGDLPPVDVETFADRPYFERIRVLATSVDRPAVRFVSDTDPRRSTSYDRHHNPRQQRPRPARRRAPGSHPSPWLACRRRQRFSSVRDRGRGDIALLDALSFVIAAGELVA
jgi:hypothetical protein